MSIKNNINCFNNWFKKTFVSIDFWKISLLWVFIGALIAYLFNSVTYIDELFKHIDSSNKFIGSQIFSFITLITGVFFGPIFGYLVDKTSKYKIILFCILFLTMLMSFLVFPLLSSITLFWAIFLPSISLFYVFRSINDGFITIFAEKRKHISYGITRSFFYVGYSLGSLLSLLIIQYTHFSVLPSGILKSGFVLDTRLYFFAGFGFILILLLIYFQLFFKPIDNTKKMKRKKNFKNLIKLSSFKSFLNLKTIITLFIPLLFFGLTVAVYEVQDVIIQNVTISWNTPEFKSFADVISIIPYFIGFSAASFFIRNFGLKKTLFVTTFLSFWELVPISLLLYSYSDHPAVILKWLFVVMYAVVQGISGGFMWAAFFEYFSALTLHKERSKVISIFNGISYGISPFILIYFIGFFLKNRIEHNLAYYEFILLIIPAVAFLMVFFIDKKLKPVLH